jgi:hypothetical protein
VNRLSDLDANCAARRVLVRHWIDLGKASLRTINGVLTVHGTLEKLPHSNSPLTPSVVAEIASELRRIQSVRRVALDFNNWTEQHGKWTNVVPKSASPILRRALPTGGVFEINTSELPNDISELL